MKFVSLLVALLCLTSVGFAWRFPSNPHHHKGNKPELRESFSMVGKYGDDALPLEIYWHHDGDLAAIYLTMEYSDQYNNTEQAYVVQVFDLDDGMLYLYYNTSEKERCHSYRVDGDVPKHFWKGQLMDGTGMCGNQPVTFWRGSFNVLYYGYPFDDVQFGVDQNNKPVCVNLDREGNKQQGQLGYVDGEPPREKLKPSWVILKCAGSSASHPLPAFFKWAK